MRRSLAWMFVAVSAIVAVAFVVPLGFLIRSTAEDRAIDMARSEAASVVPAIVADGPRAQLEAAVAATAAGAEGRMTVVTDAGWVIGPPVENSALVEAALRSGSSDIGDAGGGGREVVAAVAGDRGQLSAVRVFVPSDELRRGQWVAWSALLFVAAVLVGLSVVVADRLALTVVRPTQHLASAAAQLGSGDMDTRVTPEGPPELVELSRAFNDLARRVSAMITHERELVAELSHRLRTPLTALSMRLDQVQDPAVADALRGDVDRLTTVVDQLIAEARRHPAKGESVACDAGRVVAERVEFWTVLAQDQDRPWRFHRLSGVAQIAMSEAELAAAVDVLIENVFAHTPEGTALSVWVRREDESIRIGVADDGPGFEPTLVAAGRSSTDSTGLGLSIARRSAERAGGRLELRRRQPVGMSVELIMPQIGPQRG